MGRPPPAGRAEIGTLGVKKAEQITVPVASIEAQRRFDELCNIVQRIRSICLSAAEDSAALIPAVLSGIFERQVPALKTLSDAAPRPITQAIAVDNRFKEAVLVGAIIKAFDELRGQPIGNFRLQKAVYFARRFMGERALDKHFFRKAAGPYSPSMRYAGGNQGCFGQELDTSRQRKVWGRQCARKRCGRDGRVDR